MSTILGGGISGLAAAHYLSKRGINPITIFELSSRIGGWIRTEKYLDKGFIFEKGPRTIRPVGPAGQNTLQLIEEIGLADSVVPITKDHEAAKRRLIYVNKELYVLPSSLKGVLTKQPPFTKPLVSSIFHDLLVGKSKNKLKDESIYSFVERRFGKEIADYAISPLICGICAGDAKEISVKFLMKDMFAKEQKYGSVVKGMLASAFSKKTKSDGTNEISQLARRAKDERWSIYSMNGGLELLPATLGRKLKEKNINFKLSTECREITFRKKNAFLNINGEHHRANYLISAIPSYRLASLISKQHPKLADLLNEIPYIDVALINLQYDQHDVLKETGFGFLTVPSENIPILGVIFDSCCFNMKGNTILTVMMGGRWFKKHFGDNPTEDILSTTATKYVKDILNIDKKPKSMSVNILRNCIPQYVVGHHERLEKIEDYIETNELPLGLCGAPYYGVGVNDVILSAKKAVDAIDLEKIKN